MFQRLQEIAQVAAGWINISRVTATDPEQNSRITSHLSEMHKAVSSAAERLELFYQGQMSLKDAKTAGKNFSDAVHSALQSARGLSAADREALVDAADAKLALDEMHAALSDLIKAGKERIPEAYSEAKRRDFCLTARTRYIAEIESIAVSDEGTGLSPSQPHSDTVLDLARGIDEAFNPSGPNLQALHDAAHRAWERDCALALETPGGLSYRPNEELVLGIKERIENELLAHEPALGAREAAIHSHFSALHQELDALTRSSEPPPHIDSAALAGRETEISSLDEAPASAPAAEVASLALADPTPRAEGSTATPVTPVQFVPLEITAPRRAAVVTAPAAVLPVAGLTEAAPEANQTQSSAAQPLALVGQGTFVAPASAPVAARPFGRMSWGRWAAAAAVLALTTIAAYWSSSSRTQDTSAPGPDVAIKQPSPAAAPENSPPPSPQEEVQAAAKPQEPAAIPPVAVAPVPLQEPVPAHAITPPPLAAVSEQPAPPINSEIDAGKSEPQSLAGAEMDPESKRLLGQAVSAGLAKASSYAEEFEKFWTSLVAAAQRTPPAIKAVEENPPAPALALTPPAANQVPGQEFSIGDLSSPLALELDTAPAAAPVTQIGSLQSPVPASIAQYTPEQQVPAQQALAPQNTGSDFGLGSLSTPFVLGEASNDSAPPATAVAVESGVEWNMGSIGSGFPVNLADTENIGQALANTSLRLEERSPAAPVRIEHQSSSGMPPILKPAVPVRTFSPFSSSSIGFLQSGLGPEIAQDSALAAAEHSSEIGFLQSAPQFAARPVDDRAPVAPVLAQGTAFPLGSLQSSFDFASAVLTTMPDHEDDVDFFTLGSLGQPFGKLASSKAETPVQTASTNDRTIRVGMLDDKFSSQK